MTRLVCAVYTAAAVALAVGCATSQPASWPGKFFSNTHTIDFNDHTYDINDVKIVCRQDGSGLNILITAPDGTKVTSTRPQDGSPRADIKVAPGDREWRTLGDAAVWQNVNGEWGFEGNPDVTDSHGIFYLHDGAAICPNQ